MFLQGSASAQQKAVNLGRLPDHPSELRERGQWLLAARTRLAATVWVMVSSAPAAHRARPADAEGFTLVEVIVTLSVLALLTALGVVAFTTTRQAGTDSAARLALMSTVPAVRKASSSAGGSTTDVFAGSGSQMSVPSGVLPPCRSASGSSTLGISGIYPAANPSTNLTQQRPSSGADAATAWLVSMCSSTISDNGGSSDGIAYAGAILTGGGTCLMFVDRLQADSTTGGDGRVGTTWARAHSGTCSALAAFGMRTKMVSVDALHPENLD